MGYDFSIGEAVLYAPTPEEIDTGDDRAELRVRVTPLRTEDDGALMDHGYGSFLAFTTRAGLRDLFFKADSGHRLGEGLMPSHPGCARLTPAHLARFRAALAVADAHDTDGEDASTARWFVKWTERALAECKVPALYNR